MKKPLMILPIKTPIFHAGNSLEEFILGYVPSDQWQEGCLLAITSKIISLAEGSLVPETGTDKNELIKKEADYYLGEIGFGTRLTIKNNLLQAAAGIDESNSEKGDYILLPRKPFESAQKLHRNLNQKLNLKNFGILITDSHSKPLRLGVTGAALAFWGFQPLQDLIGHKDLFGRSLKMTRVNVPDSLASSAVFMMGEAAESTPLAIIQNAPVNFCAETNPQDLFTSVDEDMYRLLYAHLIQK